LPFARPSQAAADSGFLVAASRAQTVFNQAAFEFAELPSEHILVKRSDSFWIVGVNLEMNYARHVFILSEDFAWVVLLLLVVIVAADPIHR
jgi:hypothetical protein